MNDVFELVAEDGQLKLRLYKNKKKRKQISLWNDKDDINFLPEPPK